MIDGEKVISDYLRGHGLRAVGKTPPDTSTAWIRVTLLDARDESEPTDHLISYLLQLDCYAGKDGGQPEANTLARNAREALRVMPQATHVGAVVTAVRFTGHARIPDASWEPARDRVVITCEMFAHPAPVAA